MDHYSILDHSPSSPAVPANISPAAASGSAAASISAKIAAANRNLPPPSEAPPRTPTEDAGRSLAEMAHRDLDAALQLLAERALYITGASGTAIALRRGEHNDMLCRATTGSSAPELGALLSMEHGLSGECVRTRQLLRCDDAERDPRVNREVCRELGIASVVVMPIVSDDQVLGVFELLSGKPRAFEERDLSALLRLSEMVETAVKHAGPVQMGPIVPEVPVAETRPPTETRPPMDAQPPSEVQPLVEAQSVLAQVAEKSSTEPAFTALPPEPVAMGTNSVPVSEPARRESAPQGAAPAKELTEIPEAKIQETETKTPKTKIQETAAPPAKKTLFWSATTNIDDDERPQQNPETNPVPAVLRNLQKCQACGFPVSQGRAFCVECEEKQWRGQPPKQSAASQPAKLHSAPDSSNDAKKLLPPSNGNGTRTPNPASPQLSAQIVPAADARLPQPPQEPKANKIPEDPAPNKASAVAVKIAPQTLLSSASSSLPPIDIADAIPADVPEDENAAPFLSSAMPSESWLASNKYILGALLVVAIIIVSIVWLR
jgi:GAF domain-containing protein